VLCSAAGGGFAVGHALTYSKPLWDVLGEAERAGRKAVIFSIEYSLAPEFPFPKALNECVDAYRFLVHNLNIPPGKIVLAGDSAGGNLCVTTSLLLRDLHEPLPAGLVLIAPWVSLDATTPSYSRNHRYDILTHAFLKEKRDWYLQNRAPTPLSSPILANLAGLPPALVFAGDRELFFDDVNGWDREHVSDVRAAATLANRHCCLGSGGPRRAAFVHKYQQANSPAHVRFVAEKDMFHDYMLTENAGAVGRRALKQWAAFVVDVTTPTFATASH